MTDYSFRIPAIRLIEEQCKHQPDSYMYLFTWPSPYNNGELGSPHAIEIPFVFGSLALPRSNLFASSSEETELLSQKMMDSWISFARMGDPNHDKIPLWAPYSPEKRSTLFFGKEIKNG